MDKYSISVEDYNFTLNVMLEKKADGGLIGTVIGLPDCQAEGWRRANMG